MTEQSGSTRRRTGPVAWLLIAPIRFYQRFITPYTPATCRYYPTCSEYAVRSLRTHGAAKGTILTIWRLLRCNPWSSGGVDHTPERGRWRYIAARPPASQDDGDGYSPRDGESGIADVTTQSAESYSPRDGESGGNGVIAADRSLETFGAAAGDTDESALPSSGAPSAGRTAA